jgi:glutathione peroxidase
MAEDIYDFELRTIEGKDTTLAEHRGEVLLVVNTASECGFTPQYEGLERLYEKYHARGLSVLGFPCNQFGGQEPGSSEEIQEFCKVRFGVTFPLFERIEVNGPGTHPLYEHLKSQAPGLLGSRNVKWNFTKFLVGRDGKVLERFSPTTKPEAIERKIEAALDAPA